MFNETSHFLMELLLFFHLRWGYFPLVPSEINILGYIEYENYLSIVEDVSYLHEMRIFIFGEGYEDKGVECLLFSIKNVPLETIFNFIETKRAVGKTVV